MTSKAIINVVISAAIVGYAIVFIVQGYESYRAIDYKRTFNEYQSVVYQQGYAVSQCCEKMRHQDRATAAEIEIIRDYVDERTSVEDSLYLVVDQFPEKYEYLRHAACRLHEEIGKVRQHYRENFAHVPEKESVIKDLIMVSRAIDDEIYDCTIIEKEEVPRIKEAIKKTTEDILKREVSRRIGSR